MGPAYRMRIHQALVQEQLYEGPIDGEIRAKAYLALDALAATYRLDRTPTAASESDAVLAPKEPAAEVWRVIQESSSIAVLETFAKRYPDSIYSQFARARIKEISTRP